MPCHNTFMSQDSNALDWHSYIQGTAMGRVVRRIVVTTNESMSGWGPLCDSRPVFSMRVRDQKPWHINFLEIACSFGAAEFSSFCERPQCSNLKGQHGSGGVHQSPGRNGFMHPTGLGKKPALVGRSGTSLDSRSPCAGHSELQRGHTVQRGYCSREWRLNPQTVKLIVDCRVSLVK